MANIVKIVAGDMQYIDIDVDRDWHDLVGVKIGNATVSANFGPGGSQAVVWDYGNAGGVDIGSGYNARGELNLRRLVTAKSNKYSLFGTSSIQLSAFSHPSLMMRYKLYTEDTVSTQVTTGNYYYMMCNAGQVADPYEGAGGTPTAYAEKVDAEVNFFFPSTHADVVGQDIYKAFTALLQDIARWKIELVDPVDGRQSAIYPYHAILDEPKDTSHNPSFASYGDYFLRVTLRCVLRFRHSGTHNIVVYFTTNNINQAMPISGKGSIVVSLDEFAAAPEYNVVVTPEVSVGLVINIFGS